MNPQRPKILAIDDNPENLMVLGTALEADFEIQVASSGPQGLSLARVSPPDLVLLDVMMPEVSGFETCRLFKSDTELAEIPIIFLTAVDDLGAEISGLELGAVDYITKPIKVALVRQRVKNILQLTRLSHELKESEERLRLVMDATGEGIWDWNMVTGEVIHNATWCRMLGLSNVFLSHPMEAFSERVHPDDAHAVQQALRSCLEGDGTTYQSEHRLRHVDGHYVWLMDRGQVVERDREGRPLRMVGSIRDIDERKRSEAEIFRLAFYDPLTALPNRRLLIDRLEQAIVKNNRQLGFGALMFLDMDRFKQLNDTHGHAMGDLLLVQVAERLRCCVREQDTVARLGGDEFVVMLEHLAELPETALHNALIVGQKILKALNAPYQLNALRYISTPSIGLTLFAGKKYSVDGILKLADAAMYKAKQAGRNNIQVDLGDLSAVPQVSIS